MSELVSWASYHSYDVEIIDEIQNVYSEMVGHLAYQFFSGKDDCDIEDRFSGIKKKFDDIIEKYDVSNEDAFEELKGILVRTYNRFAENIIKIHKDDNLCEDSILDKAFSKLSFN